MIGVDGFGKIAFAMSVIVYFLTITDWGFNYSATRDVARNRGNIDEISKIYSLVTSSKIFLMLVSAIVLFAIVFLIPQLNENAIILFLSFSIVVGHILFPEWLFQGLEDMKLMVLLNIGAKLLFTLLIFLVIKQPDDYLLQPLFSGFGYVIAGVISIWYLHHKLGIRFKLCGIRPVFTCILSSFDVFLNNLMPNLYTSISVIILSTCHGSISTGILDGATKFYSVCAQFLTVLSRVFFPFLSRRLDKHSLYIRVKMLLTIIFASCLIFGAKSIILFFLGELFRDSIPVLKLFGISLVFHSVTNIYGTNYLILIGKEKELRRITVVVSIIGFIMAYPLIFFYNYIGAALTITISRIMLGITVLLYANMLKTKNSKNLI